MKINPSNSQSGNVLMVTVVSAAIIGIVLTSYLSMTSSQNRAVVRSQTWNSAIPVVEAGIEEALTQLYYNPTNLTANGWTQMGGLSLAGVTLSGAQYVKERNFGDGKFVVSISGTMPPVITSYGYVRKPMSTEYLARKVQVNTRRDGLFTKGLVAKGQITLNGNNIMVDSFDSQDPNYSSNGVYTASRRKANGDVATNSGLVNSLDSGNADIYGHVSTGRGGTVGIGNNGSVGDLAWHAAGNDGVEPGYSSSDMNVAFPDVKLPFNTAVSPPVGVGALNNYDYVISSSGNWEITGLTRGLLVRSNVNAVVLVDGDIRLAGSSDQIKIEPGGSLQVYMKGSSATLGGNGVVNQAGNATNFMYYGLPSNTSVSVSGNGAFTGVIYAPQAALTLNGGGHDNNDVVGASVTATVNLNGNFTFHYDENLGRVGPARAFVVTSWNEL